MYWRALIPHGIVHAVCIPSGAENSLLAKDRQVLGHVALRGPDGFDDVLHARLLLTEDAEYSQSKGMGNRPHGVCHLLDLLPPSDQLENVPGLTPYSLLSNFHRWSL